LVRETYGPIGTPSKIIFVSRLPKTRRGKRGLDEAPAAARDAVAQVELKPSSDLRGLTGIS